MPAALKNLRLTLFATLACMTVFSAGAPVLGDVLLVPADYLSVQAAIEAAVVGDEVVVSPGEYLENIDLLGKAITLRGTDPTDPAVVAATILNGGAVGPVLVCQNGEGPNTVISGLTMTNPSDVTFTGPGMINSGSSPTVTHCVFRNINYTGMRNSDGSNPTVTDCWFIQNQWSGMRNSLSDPVVTRCVFRQNKGGFEGAGVENDGSHAFFVDCGFHDNYNASWGGGMSVGSASRITLRRCRFTGNHALSNGGGLFVDDHSEVIVDQCTFIENTASKGGAYFCGLSDGGRNNVLRSCLFARNSAGRGAAIYSGASDAPVFWNCTIVDNVADGQFSGGIEGSNLATPRFWSCIIWGNSPAQMDAAGAVTHNSLVQSDTNPNSPSRPTFAFSDDYHILSGSLGIDLGATVADGPSPFDLDGNERVLPVDERVDMGAYEFDPDRSTIALSTSNIEFTGEAGHPIPSAGILSIRNAGGVPLQWSLGVGCSWVIVSPTSGVSEEEIDNVTVSVDVTGLPRGIHTCPIEVQEPLSSNGPRSVLVELRLKGELRVPEAFPTIQDAIDAANVDGDVVVLSDGVYRGAGNKDLDFEGRDIVVRCENGPDNCIVDCEGIGRAFHFHTEEPRSAGLQGITMRNGHATSSSTSGDDGGAILITDDAQPTIKDCVFEQNVSDSDGGAIRVFGAGADLIGCRVLQNQASFGGGISLVSSTATIVGCEIRGNSADRSGGGVVAGNGGGSLTNCLIVENAAGEDGGGLWASTSVIFHVDNCTLAGNESAAGSDGIWTNNSRVYVANSILWQNGDTDILGPATVAHSIVRGGWQGDGIIDADPLFVDSAGGDYRLQAGSPGIDSGDTSVVPADSLDLDGDGDTAEPLPIDFAGMVRLANDPAAPDSGAGPLPHVDMGAFELQSDCNDNGIDDAAETDDEVSPDCNANALPDECDLELGFDVDVNGNQIPDSCEADCNDNGITDDLDISSDRSEDCNENQIPDECEVSVDSTAPGGPFFCVDQCDAECNDSGIPDNCELVANDCNEDGVPDECQADCNQNGTPDDCDLTTNHSDDCNGNLVPDECEIDSASNAYGGPFFCDVDCNADCNITGIPDECELVDNDCNADGVPDDCTSCHTCRVDDPVELAVSEADQIHGLGTAVSISGNTMAVAHGEGSSEKVFVFERDPDLPGQWREAAILVGPFSGSRGVVVLKGSTAIVSGDYRDARVYERRADGSGEWDEVATLSPPDGHTSRRFGVSLALQEDVAIVGASQDDDACEPSESSCNAGAAYIFSRDFGGSNQWGFAAKLFAGDAQAFDSFGTSVSIDDDLALVGARNGDNAGVSSGAAYLYRHDGAGAWHQVAKLLPEALGSFHRFGSSVALSGDTAIVGAYQDDNSGQDAGAAFVFQRDWGGPDQWGQVARIVGRDTESFDRFGWSVALWGDWAAVGAPRAAGTGAAYLFHRHRGGPHQWGPVRKVESIHPGILRDFGSALDLDRGLLVIGSPDESQFPFESSGAVFVVQFMDDDCDCDCNDVPDACELDGRDCNRDGFIDECQPACVARDTPRGCMDDCNENGIPDDCDIAEGQSRDCDFNERPDECDIPIGSGAPGGPFYCTQNCDPDCNGSGVPDVCEIFGNDCNGNDVPDECDAAESDCNEDLIPDDCQADCNDNGVPDDCDTLNGTSADCNEDGIPDECQSDCNNNGIPDDCDVAIHGGADCNEDGIPDECQMDCNANSVPDDCDVAAGTASDCNEDGVPDRCQIDEDSAAEGGPFFCTIRCDPDCNGSGIPDDCELQENDCNENGVPDICEIWFDTPAPAGPFFCTRACDPDCNATGIPDACELIDNDCNGDHRPDECGVVETCRGGAEAMVFAHDVASNSEFGASIAVDGQILVIGAPRDNAHAFASGAAYVFLRNGSFTEVAKLKAGDAEAWELFGNAVAISGNTIVVGAPWDDERGDKAGAAYIFERNQGGADTWGAVTKIMAFNAGANDEFGHSVDIDGDFVIFGAPGEDANCPPNSPNCNTGAVYVHHRDQGGPDQWGFARMLTHNIQTPGPRRLGYSVALDDGLVLAGAPSIGFGDDGAVFAFSRNSGSVSEWLLVKKLTRQDTRDFGRSVAISKRTAVVGAPRSDHTSFYAGIVVVYSVPQALTSSWGNGRLLSAPNENEGNEFGHSVVIDHDTLVVGSNPSATTGRAYVFRRGAESVSWSLVNSLEVLNADRNDDIGVGVAVVGDSAFVGFGDDCTAAGECGDVVYAFGLAREDCNCNGVTDACDVVFTDPDDNGEVSDDCNANGVPDECDSIVSADFDGDSRITLGDYRFLEACLAGPDAVPGMVDGSCRSACTSGFDSDGDGDVDLQDAGAFARLFTVIP